MIYENGELIPRSDRELLILLRRRVCKWNRHGRFMCWTIDSMKGGHEITGEEADRLRAYLIAHAPARIKRKVRQVLFGPMMGQRTPIQVRWYPPGWKLPRLWWLTRQIWDLKLEEARERHVDRILSDRHKRAPQA